MKFTLTFDCDNAAFEDSPAVEVARILEVVKKYVERFGLDALPVAVLDLNGNSVGAVKLTGRRKVVRS